MAKMHVIGSFSSSEDELTPPEYGSCEEHDSEWLHANSCVECLEPNCEFIPGSEGSKFSWCLSGERDTEFVFSLSCSN